MEKMYENNFSTADDTSLYLDVDGFEYHRKRMLASVENLVLDTSHSFAMEDEVNGTESVQMLIDHWHKVAETTENFRRFYIDYVDPALVRVKDSIINEDAEVADQLNTEAEIDINDVVHKGLENIRNGFKKATMALVDLFDSDMDENVRAILNKDAYLWTKEEAYLVSKRYSKAVKAHNVEALNDFYNSLLVVNNSDMYDIDEHGRKVYYSSAHLDKEKAFVILANLEAMDGVYTEAYQTLLELTAGEFSYAEKSKLKLTSKINISKNEQGFVIDWKTSMDGKQRDSHQTMLFFDDGLSLRERYERIDSDIEGVGEYKNELKLTIISQELADYESVQNNPDFKKLSKYIEEEEEKYFIKSAGKPADYTESDVYRCINDESSRYKYAHKSFSDDHIEYISDEQKAVYNYLYQQDKVNHTNKAKCYRKILTEIWRDQFADDKDSNASNLEKATWGILVGADKAINGFRQWPGIGNQENIDDFGEQIPTAIGRLDPKLDKSLTGGWHTLYDVNKLIGASYPGVALNSLTGGTCTVAEIIGAGSIATFYGGSAYGNAIGYAEQSGYSDSQAKAFATKTGINEGCKTLVFYGLLKGTGTASSAGYLSAGESAAVSAAGGFGIEFIDETSVKPNIQESTLGEEVDVDYKRALENAAVAGLITGAAGYVYTKAQGKNVEEQNIYENTHALDRKINQHLSQDINENLQASSSLYEEIYNKQYEVFQEYEEYAAQLKPVDYIDKLKGEFIDRGQKSGLSFNESLEAYRALETGDYERMARFFDTFSNEDKAVFWSGDLKAAIEYAESINGTVMEQTPGGNTFNNWEALNDVYLSNYWGTGKILDQKPIWKALSKQYAEGATGKVTYIHPDGYYGRVWTEIEQPILLLRKMQGYVSEIVEVTNGK